MRHQVKPKAYMENDRRPLKSRSWPLMARLAKWLAAREISPNQISVAGMVFGIGAGAALAMTSIVNEAGEIVVGWARVLFILAAVLIQLRLLCNLIDGMVAIEGKKQSKVGMLYNELPDRVSDVAGLVGAGFAAMGNVELGFAAAVFAVMTAYVRAVGKAEGAGNDFCGPMAKPHRMAMLTVMCMLMAVLPSGAHAWWSGVVRDVAVHMPGVLAEKMMTGVESRFGLMGFGLLLIAMGSAWTCVRRTVRLARRMNA